MRATSIGSQGLDERPHAARKEESMLRRSLFALLGLTSIVSACAKDNDTPAAAPAPYVAPAPVATVAQPAVMPAAAPVAAAPAVTAAPAAGGTMATPNAFALPC